MLEAGPNPRSKYPIAGYDKLIFLNNIVQASNIFIGDYTYFDDPKNGPEKFLENNVLYNHQLNKTKLIIGKFCALAAETKFIMAGNHKLDAFSTYPFPVFKKGWEKAYITEDLPSRGDIVVGNDVWFGYDSLIMPGVKIGHGAIIGTRTVVTKEVPPYAVVVGNPGRIVKKRFDDKTIERLLALNWWDWPLEKITKHVEALSCMDLNLLEKAAKERPY